MPVTIVATSHIASESIREVEETILKEKPECVAVELDRFRYQGLKSQEKSSNVDLFKQLGPSTFFVVWIFKKLQQWLGSKVGIFPGTEMMKAVETAKNNNIKVALIDQDIGTTLNEIKNIPRGEKLKLIWYLIKAPILIRMPGLNKGNATINLSEAPSEEVVELAIKLLETEFPTLYKVLLENRNIFMAEKIKELQKHFEKIVVIVGAGHKKGLEILLK